MANLSDDLENWMGKLPDELRDIPIINLAIPGSHDSMSYGINKKATIAPDAEPGLANIYRCLPCVVRRWAKTQYLSVDDQWRRGVRFFDLRMGTNKKNNNFYFVHGLYCEEISDPLYKLNEFLDTHKKEFIILDCQHFYDFTTDDHKQFIEFLLTVFKDKIYGRTNDSRLEDCTLNSACNNSKQILIIYRNGNGNREEFWRNVDWPTPWPNEIDVNNLKAYLENTMKQRNPSSGFVSQCVLTPTTKFIIPRFFASLRTCCAKPINKKLADWIKSQTPGPFADQDTPTANVFLADFVDIQDSNFCKIVIDLNSKIVIEALDSGDTFEK